MFKKLTSLFKKPSVPSNKAAKEYSFRWYDVGAENPFGVRVLDVRQFTSTIVATTKDRKTAESYVALRQSDGKELISASIREARTVQCKLRFPHNGAALNGIVFKAGSMDVKWDIYIYDGVFYFARSWTGELMFKAPAIVTADSILISEIQCTSAEAGLAASHVFFLLGNHAMGRVLPHRLPSLLDMGDMQLATLSFNLFGNRACYATFEEITQISLEPRNG